jgi:hypothetical protein
MMKTIHIREEKAQNPFFCFFKAGAIKTTSTIIDFETIGTTTFLMTAYVSDGQASASGTVTISITNQNEAPTFLLSTYTITGNEGSVRSVTHTYFCWFAVVVVSIFIHIEI